MACALALLVPGSHGVQNSTLLCVWAYLLFLPLSSLLPLLPSLPPLLLLLLCLPPVL